MLRRTILIAFLICSGGLVAADTAEDILQEAGIAGGLVVHLGCGDGELTAELHASDAYLVHGLDTDRDDVEKARRHLKDLGLYGPVTADSWNGSSLPYVDNTVNLLVVEDAADVARSEMMRVLAPEGIAYIRNDRGWRKTVKPRPDEIDEWTHFLHDASGNAVANDAKIGPPKHLQWFGTPKWARAHEQLASVSSMVSAGGRVFYIVDKAPRYTIRLPGQWKLVARDAFNGVVLWQRSMGRWVSRLRPFRSGPPHLPFRLVAVGDRVYVTLSIDGPVTELDAVTGETLREYPASDNTQQILHSGGLLVMLVDKNADTARNHKIAVRRGREVKPVPRRVVAADPATGKALWRRTIKAKVYPAMAAKDGRLFYQTPKELFCLDIKTGEPLWHVKRVIDISNRKEPGWETPILTVADDVVYSADFKNIVAFRVKSGKELWTGPAERGYHTSPDVFKIDGLMWVSYRPMRRKADMGIGRDPITGEVKRKIDTAKAYYRPSIPHHRCYKPKATENYILLSQSGVEFIDVRSGEIRQHHWIRGTCQYGIMPCNGLLYCPPDSCACTLQIKLNGFYALAAEREVAAKSTPQHERGPAFGEIASRPEDPTDWPTYRSDAQRTSSTAASVPEDLDEEWKTSIGGRISSPVCAGGMVFVAGIDENTLYALDAEDGGKLWSYMAGGRIDSPPTVYNGSVLFGSADGWVYSLRATDGEMAWRFRAAPEDRRTVAHGRLESVWPVHGSVLVKDDVLIVTAGRSSYLDGGIRLYRLDPQTGRKLSETPIYSPDPETGEQPAMGGCQLRGVLSDVLSAKGDDVFMRHLKLDFEKGSQTGDGHHLFSQTGFLDDDWWHRTYWIYGKTYLSGWARWWRVGNNVASGRIMALDGENVYGYGRDKYPGGNTGQFRGGEEYHLYAVKKSVAEAAAESNPGRRRRGKNKARLEYTWRREMPVIVRALVIADDMMFVAGPPDIGEWEGKSFDFSNRDAVLDAWKGGRGGILMAVSAGEGETVLKRKLEATPVFDGMIAANGRLYISLTDGSVVSMAK